MSDKPSETHEIILAWLRDEFPQAGWKPKGASAWMYSSNTTGVREWLTGEIGGITLELAIQPKECVVEIWTKTPHKKPGKVREVSLTDPTSIENLQEVVRHTIKITTNPFLPPR